MADPSSTIAAALQLDTPASQLRFVRAAAIKTDDNCLHLYEHRNGTYSIHGSSDVPFAARIAPDDFRAVCELPAAPPTVTSPLETLYFNKRLASDLVSKTLYQGGRRVVLYGVASDGRLSKKMEGSPGRMEEIEDEFLERYPGAGAPILEEGAVMAVRVLMERGMMLLGCAVWDPAGRRLWLGDLFEDDVFSGLEGVLVAMNVKEAVLCQSDFNNFKKEKLQHVVERCGVVMTEMAKEVFKEAGVDADLGRLVGGHLQIAKYLDSKASCSAAAALIDYMRIMEDEALEGKVKLAELGGGKFMQLDNNVMRALNIMPYPGDGGKNGSLYSLLNRTKSAMGGRLLRKWLSQPLQNMQEINNRLDVTEALINDPSCCRDVRDLHINKMPDVNLLCKRFTRNNGAKASLQDVVRLYQCSIRLPFLCECMEGASMAKVFADKFALPLRKLIADLQNFEALVETTIDLDRIDNAEFVVSPAVDPELKELREQQDDILTKISEEHEHVSASISGLKNDSLKLERKDNLGYIFRLTRKEEKFIRGKKQYTVLETRKDGVRFQTKSLRRLSESYQELAGEYDSKERIMRDKTLEVAGSYVDLFMEVSAILAEIDVMCAFAVTAVHSRSSYTRPEIKPAGTGLVLKQARHPIVEENMDDSSEFIANDIDLRRGPSETMDEGGALLLVTGPNMGGKSTYIRSAGVLTLMAHIGCYVPAEKASIPITDRIFSRVGAGDNQHRAISTFMSEMLETAAILRSATDKSLVIIDELGRGTGTTDGYGLAYAISHHIATKMRSCCLFATHFFELTTLSENVPAVRNVHVSAVTDPQSNKLTFLYEVQEGACDQSFGVHVAEIAHFPDSVVSAAKRKAAELEGFGISNKRLKSLNISEEDEEKGYELISGFLDEVNKLPMETEEDKRAALEKTKRLRKRVLAENNPYVMALVTEGQ